MPFTVSHIAAVLPAHRALSRARLLSAAIIGSMVPDFGMLLPGSLARWQTHSLAALFSFCLPVGLAVYALTLLLIKPAMMEILPDRAYARLSVAQDAGRPLSVASWLYAALAILFGAVTHLIWDGFTHERARGVRMFPILDAYGPELDGHSLQLYRLLQYGSSVLGLLVVMVALVLWLRHAPPPAQPPRRRLQMLERCAWSGLYIALPLFGMAVSLWHLHAPALASWPVGTKLERIAMAGMRASGVSLVLVSLLLLLRLLPYRRAPRT
jgi:hypothetical protein